MVSRHTAHAVPNTPRMLYSSPMRRWLALVLLCLLPLQVSWAVVADYCAHERGQAVQHFGHHDDEHEVWAGASDDPAQPDTSALAHDHHSHVTGFVGLPGDAAPIVGDAWSGSLRAADHPHPASIPPDQPERPKWLVPA